MSTPARVGWRGTVTLIVCSPERIDAGLLRTLVGEKRDRRLAELACAYEERTPGITLQYKVIRVKAFCSRIGWSFPSARDRRHAQSRVSIAEDRDCDRAVICQAHHPEEYRGAHQGNVLKGSLSYPVDRARDPIPWDFD